MAPSRFPRQQPSYLSCLTSLAYRTERTLMYGQQGMLLPRHQTTSHMRLDNALARRMHWLACHSCDALSCLGVYLISLMT